METIIIPNRKKIEARACKSALELEQLDKEIERNRQLYLNTLDEKYLEETIKLTLSWKPRCTISYLQRHLYAPETSIRKIIEKLEKEGYISIDK